MAIKHLENFFGVEMRNEKFGGVSPATLESALDSWRQAPDYVRKSWTRAKSYKDFRFVEKEIMVLINRYGKDKELSEIGFKKH